MTAFGAPQRLYRGRAICTHIPSVCGTAHPQVVAFNREVQSPNEPRTSSREALSGLSSGLGQLLRTRQEEPWLWAGEEQRAGERLGTLPALEQHPPPLWCLPLLTPTGRTRLPRTAVKFCWMKIPFFRTNSLSAEGARPFRICWWSQRWGCGTWCLQLSVRKVLAL